jgi:predicted GNAT superfamily acetyltransferase
VQQAAQPDKVQLHLVLPYKFEPTDDAQVSGLLERGYRIVQFQRVTDREVIVTLIDGNPGEAVRW